MRKNVVSLVLLLSILSLPWLVYARAYLAQPSPQCTPGIANGRSGLGAILGGCGGGASIDYCFDFRSTAIYVTDVAPCQPVVEATANYPQTYGAATAGWTAVSGDNTRDRDNTADPRLAGVHWFSNDGVSGGTFRIDLPATGTYKVVVAMGSISGGDAPAEYIVLKDNATAFMTIGGTTCTAPCFIDATGVTRTSGADWVTNGSIATLSHNFTSTQFNIVVGGTAGVNFTYVAHVRITT